MDENPQSKGPVLHVVETVAETIDHLREGAAESLDSAAATVRSLSEGTATRLDSTAQFIREFTVLGSLRALVRRSPGLALGIGVSAGLLVGLALRRSPAPHDLDR